MSRLVLCGSLVFLILLSPLFGHIARAATITVDTTADDQTANGNCTLREAITAAELNTAVDTCIAGDDNNDTIDLTGVSGTITLGAVLLTITKDLTITGPGASSLTVDGNGIGGVFDIDSSTSDQTLTISGLTVTGGDDINSGGGFLVAAGDTLNLSSCVIDNNRAPNGGGIFNNGGTVTLADCTVRNNTADNFGGGISNGGIMTLNNSLVNGNTTTGSGAGIDNLGTLTLTNTTVSGNTSGGWAGGIFNNGTMTLNESLVSGNSDVLGVGGITQQGTATFINSTISGNTGVGVQNTAATGVNSTFVSSTIAFNTGTGYAHSRTVTIYSTIVANNGTNCTGTGSGTYTDAGWNLDSDDTCSFMDVTDLPNTDPLLGPLADNGGPTQTHALQTGSPAIDAGDNIGCPAADQRGIKRPQDGDRDGRAMCDIGAYELSLSKATPWIPLLLLDE